MPPKKRVSLAERIDQIVEAGEETVFHTLQELGRESDDHIGLRFHSKKTQQDQDRLLKLYRRFIKAFFDSDLLNDNSTDEQIDLSCFPTDHTAFYQRARRFLIFLIANGQPRSSEDEHITYRTASIYRRHMLFWMKKKYLEQDIEAPRQAKVFNELTEAMRGAALLRQLGTATTPKAYVGLAEIQFMIDLDMRETPSIEVAEQHHLAWCIGRATALRPSSFGPQSTRRREEPASEGFKDFMKWKDFEISRLIVLTLEASEVGPRELIFKIWSPQTKANIPFSVPHRLLIIALRRKIIEGIDTLDDLLTGQLATITFKNEALEKPVFFAAGARGLSLDETRPMPANALTAYIQIRGQTAGFPDKITFYSIRRRMATDLTNAFGNDAAREIMGHSPTSRILETSYLEFSNVHHTTAVGLGENIEGQELERRQELHQQMLRRLGENLVEKSRGQALNVLVQETLAADEDFQELEDFQDIKNYIKRTRRFCLAALWKELRAEADRTISTESLAHRKAELFKEASDFAQRVIDEVKKGKARDLSSEEARQAELQGINFDDEFAETRELTQPEDDIEERSIASGSEIVADVDEGTQDDGGSDDQAVSYLEVAQAFMEIVTTNSLNTYSPNELLKCPLCAADPTISAEDKEKRRTVSHHNTHLKAKLHYGFEKYRRSVEIALREKMEADPETPHRYECEFCVTLFPEDCGEELQVFRDFGSLARHIRESDSDFIHGKGAWKLEDAKIERHNELKQEAGWYDKDFEGDEEVKARSRASQNRNKAKAAGVAWSREPELTNGIPFEGQPGLVLGGPASEIDPSLFSADGPFRWGSLDDGFSTAEIVGSTDGFLYAGDVDDGPLGPMNFDVSAPIRAEEPRSTKPRTK